MRVPFSSSLGGDENRLPGDKNLRQPSHNDVNMWALFSATIMYRKLWLCMPGKAETYALWINFTVHYTLFACIYLPDLFICNREAGSA